MNKLDIIYDDAKHEYRRGSDGKLFAGVSSISGILNKPYLLQWAANLSAFHFRDAVKAGRTDLEEITEEARKVHNVKKTEAGQTGTDMHAIIEKHCKARIEGREPDVGELDEITYYAYKQFLSWETMNDVVWKASELLVGNMELEYAGRLDLTGLVNGRKTLIDIKTSNSISHEYYIQTAGYLDALRWMGSQVTDRLIIRLPKTLTRKVYDRKLKTYREEKNEIEIHPVPTDTEFDIETFRHMRQVYKWINQKTLKDEQ
jgi:hypothetical protein